MENKLLKKLVYVSLTLNAILLVAAILFALQFIKLSSSLEEEIPVKAIKTAKGGMAIAYVNVDSLIEQYKLVKDLQTGFDAQREKMQKDMMAKQTQFERDVRSFQNNAQSMSASEAERLEKSLGARQQQLMQLEQQYTNQLGEQEIKMKQHITDSIVNYLNKRFKNKFDYILGYTNGGGILYANEAYNITSVVLQSLNKQYEKK